MEKNDREKELKGGTGGQADVPDFVIVIVIGCWTRYIVYVEVALK